MATRTHAGLLCAVAICAALVFATGALATENLPAFGKCVAKAPSKYRNSGCTKLAKSEAEGKFEWEPLSSAVSFKAAKEKETGNFVLESGLGTEISCSKLKATGEYGPGNLLKDVVYELEGCQALGAACESEGQSAGHFNTKKLHGEPGVVAYEPAEEKNVDGYDLRGETGEIFAEGMCGPAPVTLRGGIVAKSQADSTGGTSGEWTNKMVGPVEIEYIREAGKQVPEEWTPDGEGTSNSKHERIDEHLEFSANDGATYEPAGFSVIELQASVSKVRVELRQCEATIVCPTH